MNYSTANLREEIEQFFCGPNESFTDPEEMRQKLLVLINRERRAAVNEAFRLQRYSALSDYGILDRMFPTASRP